MWNRDCRQSKKGSVALQDLQWTERGTVPHMFYLQAKQTHLCFWISFCSDVRAQGRNTNNRIRNLVPEDLISILIITNTVSDRLPTACPHSVHWPSDAYCKQNWKSQSPVRLPGCTSTRDFRCKGFYQSARKLNSFKCTGLI